MSYLDNALAKISKTIDRRANDAAPFRAIVTGTAGNLTTIQRLTAASPDAERYAKSSSDTFVAGDEVLCLPVNGKPVILGKFRR